MINREIVPVKGTVYYRDNTDKMCSFIIGDRQYHLFDGTSNVFEMMKNFLAIKGKKKRKGAYLSYDLTAEDFYKKMKFDHSKEQIFFGISRGCPVGNGALTRYTEEHKPKVLPKMVAVVPPPAGGKEYVEYCKNLGYECLRIRVKGDLVDKAPPWGKHYETKLETLKTNAKGYLKKHLSAGDNLGELEI